MPVPPEWKQKVDAKIKPYGRVRWVDAAMEIASRLAAGKESMTVLDVGCGVDSWIIRTVRGTCPSLRVIGMDVDPDCAKNPDVDIAHVASAEDIPLESESVDLITSAWVVEHLRDPISAFQEMNRVMRPGGAVLFWTPNLYNPMALVSRLTPHWFHTLVRRLVGGEAQAENSPTYYRMNTVSGIERVAARTSFVCESVCTYSNAYQYFAVCKASYIVACVLNKLAPIWPLSCLRWTLLCVLRKPEEPDTSDAARCASEGC